MSNPTGNPPENSGDEPGQSQDAAGTPPMTPPPTDAGAGAPHDDAQPTQAYPPAGGAYDPAGVPPPADAQPTQAYPPADGAYGQAPAEGYAPAGGYAQPGASTAAYPPPVYPTAGPKEPDTRPKTFGWISLGLAIGGLVLVGLAFLPLVWVSLVLALVGGVLLLVGLILGIVTLANKKQGGKGLGIAAIVVSVLGGGAWAGALVWALVLVGLATAGSGATPVPAETSAPPAIEESATPAPETTEDGGDGSTATGGEAAYLEEVRPALAEIMQEIDPSITPELLGTVFRDEVLISLGQAVLFTGEVGRDEIVASLAESGFTEDQAGRFYDTIFAAAEAHLAE